MGCDFKCLACPEGKRRQAGNESLLVLTAINKKLGELTLPLPLRVFIKTIYPIS